MEEIFIFIKKLEEERNDIRAKLKFVNEHKFIKEADFFRDRINVVGEILNELKDVAEGKRKAEDVKFYWN